MSTVFPLNWVTIASVALFTFSNIAISAKDTPISSRLKCLWVPFLVLSSATWLPAGAATWALAVTSLGALRKYFSLADIRLGDRFAILGAYLSIPVTAYCIHVDGYELFLTSIPVFGFLLIPLLVVLGNRDCRGCTVSIGIISFGLFLMVFCVGHISYLLTISSPTAVALVLGVAITGAVRKLWIGAKQSVPVFLSSAPISAALFVCFGEWTGTPMVHSIVLGSLVPALVLMGNHTLDAIGEDLGAESTATGRGFGVNIHSLGPYLFPAPVIFHYIRWISDTGI